jgi:hypothetical protein
MKNKGIIFFLVGMVLVIIVVMTVEFLSERPEHQPANPYALPMDSFLVVDEALVIFREVKDLKLDMELPTGISLAGQNLYVVGDKKLTICDLSGKLIREVTLESEPSCVKAQTDRIYISSSRQVTILNSEGKILSSWDDFNENSVLTSIDSRDGKVFIADAGKRTVYRYAEKGGREIEFQGKSGVGDSTGFIIPSANFDLAIDPSGELWVANPGKHVLENYTFDGKLKGWWGAAGNDIRGFTGCCNPANFTFLPDGNFVTSEKGIVRIKEYKPSGEFMGVVAPPSKFEGEAHAPDVVCDDQGRVYILDKERSMVRIFEKK